MNESKIEVYNREKSEIEIEKVYGDNFLNFVYGTLLGKMVRPMMPLKTISKLYGALQDLPSSASKVDEFVKEFNIEIDDFESDDDGRYISFNSFFERKLKPGKRNFVEGNKLPAFSEARYLGFESIEPISKVPIKGNLLTVDEILQRNTWSLVFENGPCLIARLAPVDYHRFHFPDDCTILDSYRIGGNLHSVNPLAILKKNDILQTNERVVTILETVNFGKLAYVEVGAICVGKIVQTYSGEKFKRGDEKGHFLFGGSTVVVIGEKGKWLPSEDIVEKTNNHMETLIKLGDEVGRVV